MDEFNAWCGQCDSGVSGTDSWAYASLAVRYLCDHLANGASAGLVWEGYDSQYNYYSPLQWSFWGLLAVDNTNATVKTYTPRKLFYALSQISKFVRPGAQSIGISGSSSSLTPLLAFEHAGLGQITIVGINTSSSAATLNGALASLPVVPHLDLYYTSASTNLAFGGSNVVSSQTFSATIPSNCVFTLTYGLSQIGVTPTNAVLVPGNTQQFTASGTDPQGHVLSPQPTFSWSASGGGTVNSAGLFTAGASAGGPFNVIATSGGISGMATVSVAGIGTLGNTNQGTLANPLWNGGAWIDASRFQAVSNAAVSTIHAQVAAIAGHYKCAIYADTGGSPGAFLYGTGEVSIPDSGWHTFPLTSSVALVGGQYYWLAVWSDDVNAQVYYSGNGGTLRWGQYSYGTWPAPITTTGSSSLNYCIYATGLPGQPGITPPRARVTLLGNGSYQIRSDGIPGNTYRIEYTDTLANPSWHGIATNAADDFGVVQCTDSPPQGLTARYYRSAGL